MYLPNIAPQAARMVVWSIGFNVATHCNTHYCTHCNTHAKQPLIACILHSYTSSSTYLYLPNGALHGSVVYRLRYCNTLQHTLLHTLQHTRTMQPLAAALLHETRAACILHS